MKIKGTDGSEDFSGLLNGGDTSPLPLLEELHPGGVVKGGWRVRAEECRETLAVGQGWWAGTIGELWKQKKHKTVNEEGADAVDVQV